MNIDIFFSSDNKFSQHLCTAMTTIHKNSLPDDFCNFYILDGGISDKNKARIEKIKQIRNCKIEYIKVNDSLFEDCPITSECRHISKQTYYRYIIPKIKPELEKCIYLDCDTIIDDSLHEFWNIDLEDNYVAAVDELFICCTDDIKRLGLKRYFNAGVLLINLKKWKEDNITDLLFSNTNVLLKSNKIKWVDQDVLNYTFNDKVKYILPKYNLQGSAFHDNNCAKCTDDELYFSKANPVIIHYNSYLKPWHENCPHDLRKKYWEYLKLSPYCSEYYKRELKKILKEFKKAFYYKKESSNTTKIKIFGITV